MDRAAVFRPAIKLAERGLADHRVRGQAACGLPSRAVGSSRHAGAADAACQRPSRPRPARSSAARTWPGPTAKSCEGGAESFYRGELACRICRAPCEEAGGWLTEADLAAFTPKWVEPLAIDYRGRPRSRRCRRPRSGFQYLECLKILEAFDLAALGHNSAEYLHLLLETIKLASADRTR